MAEENAGALERIQGLWTEAFELLGFIGGSLDVAARVYDPKFVDENAPGKVRARCCSRAPPPSEHLQHPERLPAPYRRPPRWHEPTHAPNPTQAQVSAITRKRLMAKVLQRIEQSQRVIGVAHTKLLDLRDAGHHWHELLATVERSREDTLLALERCQREHSVLLERNRELEADARVLQDRVSATEDHMAEQRRASDAALSQLEGARAALREAHGRLEAAEADSEAARGEAEDAVARAAAAEAKAADATACLDDALRRATRGDALGDRAQTVRVGCGGERGGYEGLR